MDGWTDGRMDWNIPEHTTAGRFRGSVTLALALIDPRQGHVR